MVHVHAWQFLKNIEVRQKYSLRRRIIKEFVVNVGVDEGLLQGHHGKQIPVKVVALELFHDAVVIDLHADSVRDKIGKTLRAHGRGLFGDAFQHVGVVPDVAFEFPAVRSFLDLGEDIVVAQPFVGVGLRRRDQKGRRAIHERHEYVAHACERPERDRHGLAVRRNGNLPAVGAVRDRQFVRTGYAVHGVSPHFAAEAIRRLLQYAAGLKDVALHGVDHRRVGQIQALQRRQSLGDLIKSFRHRLLFPEKVGAFVLGSKKRGSA